MTTVRYAVWRLTQDPTQRIIIGAYNATLACKFSRKARRIAQSRLNLSTDRTAVEDWETLEGGGVRAVGVGGGITGQGGDLIIIDDPVKSREEAESAVYREKCWEWYTDDLYTRLEPNGAIIIIMTRWHEDDLVGRILKSDKAGDWTVINLPAIAEEGDPLGREVGEALCPERYDRAALDDIRATQGEYSFNALYQGRPSAREGSFFKVGQFHFIDASEVPPLKMAVRSWDKAATENDGDFTAGVKIGRDAEWRFYVVDVVRGQWETHTRDTRIRNTAEMDGIKVRVRGSQDPGSAGVSDAQAFRRLLAGFTVNTERETGDKQTRADPFSAQINGGNVWIVRGVWNSAFIEEYRAFPSGTNDDQVDAGANGFNELTRIQQGTVA
jgi:predicted phage terminase large subunit-like protein